MPLTFCGIDPGTTGALAFLDADDLSRVTVYDMPEANKQVEPTELAEIIRRHAPVRQGASGLGLAAQRDTVSRYLNGGDWRGVSEHQEIESGRNDARPELDRALATARAHRCPLLVAKVDRLTRSVAFLSRLLESGVEVRFCDLPQIEGQPAGFC